MNESGIAELKPESGAGKTTGKSLLNKKEESVIRRCQRRDVGAFKLIFQEYEQSLLRSAFRIIGNRQDAEDAVQTTFLKLYRGIGKFRFQSKFSTYLFRILLNTCFDILKQKHRTDMELLEETAPVHRPKPGLKVQLEEAIGTLPQKMRTCFVLFAIEGFSHKEISEMMEIRVGTVKATIFQAKEKLRTGLAGALEGVLEKESS
jgi:RNA polymerase sigma-70 factor, ECF subfamily